MEGVSKNVENILLFKRSEGYTRVKRLVSGGIALKHNSVFEPGGHLLMKKLKV